jgi:Concanavalin A-like lectin/glucanases superfamily
MKKNLGMLFTVLMTVSLFIQCGGSGSSSQDYPRYDSGDNQILLFDFYLEKNPVLTANISGEIKDTNITLQVPSSTNISSLIATFTTNSKSIKVGDTIQKTGETANNYSSPVVYSVYNSLGEKKDYTVTVTIAPSTDKKITSFAINGFDGVIDESAGTINVTLPPRTNAESLIAYFSAVAKSVAIGSVNQVTGVTQNNFKSALVYKATAEDSSVKEYTVQVTVLPAPWNEITEFAFLKTKNPALPSDVTGIINGADIQLTLPFGLSPADLVADYTTEAQSVSVNQQAQQSGVTHNDFTSPLTYRSTAEDGSVRDYTVTVTVAKNSAKELVTFSIDNDIGIIDQNAKTVTLTVAANKVVTDKKAVFTATGASVKIGDVVQDSNITVNNFTAPIVYTVYAEDGTSVQYTVTVNVSSELIGQWDIGAASDGSYTITGTKIISGPTGDVRLFDGFMDFIRVPTNSSYDLTTAGSIEVYVNAISHKPYAGIVHKGVKKDFSDESYSLQFWGANGTDGTVRISIFNESGAYVSADSSTKLSLDKWYHIVATWDAADLKIYIDGVLESTTANTVGNVRVSSGDLIIGAQLPVKYNNTWGDLGFNGLIDDVNVFNKSLTSEEVAARYQDRNSGGTSVAAYLLSVSSRNLPLTVGLLILFMGLVTGLYMLNKKRAQNNL